MQRISIQQQLEDRIIAQSRCVVAICITTSDSIQTLAQQIQQCVLNLAWLPLIAKTIGHRGTQPKPTVCRFEENRTPITGRMILVEADYDCFFRQPLEQNTLSGGIVIHAKALFVINCLFRNFIFSRSGLLFYIFMNYPG
jgi:hypothetical protein